MNLKKFYKNNFKKLMFVPSLILILSLGIIWDYHQRTGELVGKDIDFEGGTTLTLEWDSPVDRATLEREISKKIGEEVSVSVATDISGQIREIGFEAGKDAGAGALETAVSEIMQVELTDDNYSIRSVGPAMGASFLASAQKVMVIAFVLTGAIAFVMFKIPEVSISIFICSIINVVGALAGMNLLGISLNQGSLAALLMFIGASIDDNILIVSRALEKKKDVIDHAFLAFDTGMVMFATSFLAYVVLRFFTSIPLFIDFATVLMIGSVIDIINTWLQNMGMVLWYVERKEGKAAL